MYSLFVRSYNVFFLVDFRGQSGVYVFSAATPKERASWITALNNAGYFTMKAKLNNLKLEIQSRLSNSDCVANRRETKSTLKGSGHVDDVAECPIFVITLSCDNLRCDSYGRSPSARIIVHVRNKPTLQWTKYATTEIIEVCRDFKLEHCKNLITFKLFIHDFTVIFFQKTSNPSYLCTVSFRESDGLVLEKTELLFTVYSVRERSSGTQTFLGQVVTTLSALREVDRVRLNLNSNLESQAGFLTIVLYYLGKEEGGSTESTPCRTSICQPKAYVCECCNRVTHALLSLSFRILMR